MEQEAGWQWEHPVKGLTRRRQSGGYIGWHVANYVQNHLGMYKSEHVAVAEQALGHALPAGASVHHIDGDKTNNRNDNLVICQDEHYHQILHRRADALRESGHAHYRRCRYCRQWDDPVNLYIREKDRDSQGRRQSGTVHHRACHAQAEYQRRYGPRNR